MKKYFLVLMSLLAVLSVYSFRYINTEANVVADQIFINGNIITMDEKNSIVEAIAIKAGKIIAVGKTNQLNKFKGRRTVVVDLKGKTMTPGFIDGHSHFVSLTRSKAIDLSPPPVGNITKIADIIAVLKRAQKERNIQPGQWITATRYDPDQLEEGRHPTKEDLDEAFPDNPVSIGHVSAHMSVVNSYALRISNITSATKSPAGGQVVKDEKGEPTGLLFETAKSLIKIVSSEKAPNLEERLNILDKEQIRYASFGITTAQDGSTSMASINLLKTAADRNRLFIDVAALPNFTALNTIVKEGKIKIGENFNGLAVKGTKLFTDGSPQGKTAFFTKPYQTEVLGCEEHCTGIPTTTQKALNERILFCYENNVQPFVHCNGDASIDMYINAVKNANKKYPNKSLALRPTVIHSQFVRPDQLDAYKQLGMVPSFFTNHAFFWGDVHVRNLGEERAFFLSPLKSAINKNLVFTNHTDFGVTPINQMFALWTSVARESRSGKVIGPNERVTVMEGLRAITINGAYQYGEEKQKGSLETGKIADMLILSANPLAVEVSKIKDITVLETFKNGKSIFKKEGK
jgi:predicted amidohydrolase YtcJ